MGKSKILNCILKRLLFSCLVFLLAATIRAQNAVNIFSTSSLPVSVVVDTYLIEDPADDGSSSYFVLASEIQMPFDQFLEGLVTNEIGTGLDKGTLLTDGVSLKRVQVEALKAQAVAAMTLWGATPKTNNPDFYVSEDEQAANAYDR